MIEPHATLIDSQVASHCHIGDHTVLIGSTLGHHCHTLIDTYPRRTVSYPDTTISSIGLEEVLVGRGAFLTGGVIFFTTVGGESAVVLDASGVPVETGRPRLGGCVGHRALLGARAMFQPGRVVPNGYTIVMRPEEGVARIPAALADGQPACWHEGRLAPVDEVVPGYHPPELEPAAEESIADRIARDLLEGVDGSGVRSGIIGEIGLGHPIKPAEEKVLRAAAAAQRETGAAILIHPPRDPDGPREALRIVTEAGGDLERAIVCHIDRTLFDLAPMRELATSGCYLEFDLFFLVVDVQIPAG